RQREIASRGIARNDNPVRIEALLTAMCGDPSQNGYAFVECLRELVLGRQRIVRAEHGTTGTGRQLPGGPVAGIDAVPGPAAAMKLNDHRTELGRGWHVQPSHHHATRARNPELL